jgi:DNA-directed RNA polymerase subunit beta'
VLEYFSSTHGARKGLADTALKTADSGYLTRKLADVAQNVVVTMEDCGTSQGITKGVIYKGEKVEVSLVQSIRGRVSRVNIVDPLSDEVVVEENEMITLNAAKKLEEMQIEKIQVRSPMTCEAPLGVCRRCYGMDLATGQLVEVGMAVGIIAARPVDRRAGHAAHDADVPHRRRRHARRRGEGRQVKARGEGQVCRPEHRDQR